MGSKHTTVDGEWRFPLCPGILGDALDDIERVFAEQSTVLDPVPSLTTPPPSPPSGYSPLPGHKPFHTPTLRTSAPPFFISLSPKLSLHTALDFPSLDVPSQPQLEPAEHLIATSPIIGAAVNRIVAACKQMSVTVRDLFLSLCGASLGVSVC
jgi:hypothetical protein